MSTLSRTRWAAIGAAVAITLGAGGVSIGQATSDSGDGPVAAFFPIEPCRLTANATITADSSITLDGWGDTGDCELPADISGLAANVTAVGASAQTNLRFYADGDSVPDTANLNPTPGAPATPNAVNISLSDSNGKFRVYNRFGTVGVFIDVMGYYDNHTHDDRYYTKDQVDAAIAGVKGGGTPGSGNDPFITSAIGPETDLNNLPDWTAVVSVDVTAPVAGTVLVNSLATVEHTGADGSDVLCVILRSSDPDVTVGTTTPGIQWFEKSADNIGDTGSLAGTAQFDVPAGTTTLELRCLENPAGQGFVRSSTLTALYVPGS